MAINEPVSEVQEQILWPADREVRGWIAKEPVSSYTREGLYGHINGGAEIFLQYGFQHLTVCSYKPESNQGEAEIILELYRMATPLEAFGIFSVNRAAEENNSKAISAINWTSPSQVNLVKDDYFVNILGFECGLEDLESFAVFVADRIKGFSPSPALFDSFPVEDQIEFSSKYLQGPLAAVSESALLQADFWNFAEGTRGYSSRYLPHNSRLILLELEVLPSGLEKKVVAHFNRFLDDVKIKGEEIWGANAIGRVFLYKRSGSRCGLSLGEESLVTARKKVQHLLKGERVHK